MKLWMSSEVFEDCTASYSSIRKSIEGHFNESLSAKDYGGGLDEWAYMAIILPPGYEEYKEIERYDRREKVAEFRYIVDYFMFKNSPSAVRAKLVCESMLRCLASPVIKKLPDFDHDELARDFKDMCQARDWL